MLTDLHRNIHDIRREAAPAARVYGERFRTRLRDLPGAPGARYRCAVCERWYLRFMRFGLRGRRNARCPGCGSLERHRFMWLYLTGELGILSRRRRVLHVAPEPCIRRNLLRAPNLRYAAIDMYQTGTAQAMDLTRLDFADRSFDLILCSHVLEHIEDDRKAMAEIARVLRPTGRAVVMVPIDRNREETYEDPSITAPAERHAAFGHPYHVRVCGWDYGKRLTQAGFDVAEVHSTDMPPHRRRVNRISKTMLYDCRLGAG
jgi:SAM-dependent methyltransferase